MIRVQNLTKRFLSHTAVDGISFEVEEGEIVGFLGPNGAGKTTTLRILTTFLSATSGTATVAGCDIFSQSLELRRKIGYMPENVPLYTDMRVKEYLRFRAALHRITGRPARVKVGEVLDICGLKDVRKKIIGTLSKGYRQRVGLADALIHNPELLILDEPTNGLDPNQIRQARDLIKRLGESHTILLSTHILPEVEMTCGRVIIIDQGRIRASDTPANLVGKLRTARTVSVELKADAETAAKALTGIQGVRKLIRQDPVNGWTSFILRVESQADIREDVFNVALENRWPVRELSQKTPSLEDVFVDLTQPVAEA